MMSPPSFWSIRALRGGLGHQERTACHHVVLQVPVRDGGVQQRLRQRQAGVVDDDVDAAERQHRGVDSRLHRGFVGDVGGDADRHIGVADLFGGGGGLFGIQVGDHHAGALGGQPGGDGLADARGGAGDQRDAGGQRFGFGHPGQLGLFQGPVLDAELLGLVDGCVGGDRLGPAHHVDGVEVELAGDPGGLLVLAVAEHSDAGDQHDRGVGAADRRAVGGGVAVVVRPVVGAVGLVQFGQPGFAILDRRVGRQVEDHRLDLGAQEVIGAAGAQRGQPRMLGGAEEFEHPGVVGEVPDLRLVGGGQAADERGQRGRLRTAVVVGQRVIPVQRRAEGLAAPAGVDVSLGGLDDFQRMRLGFGRGAHPMR